MANDRVVSYLDAYVAAKLQPGHRWRSIGTEAGLTSDELSTIPGNLPESLYVFATILAWTRRNQHLTVGTLITALNKLRHSQTCLSYEDLDRSLSVIPEKGWRMLGKQLGASDSELDKVGSTFDRDCKKRVLGVLIDWQVNRTEDCTLANLFAAVRKLGGCDGMWDANDSPTLTPFELWEAYQEIQLLDAEDASVRFGIDVTDLKRRLEHLEVDKEFHCLAVFDEWRLQKPQECKLGTLFGILCDLERVEEASRIYERFQEFRWVKKVDTRIIPKEDLRRVLDSVPIKQWHHFGRELGLSTLQLFEIQKAAGSDVILEIIRVWMEGPSMGSRFMAFKRAVEKSGGVLFEEDDKVVYEDMMVPGTNDEDISDDYITLDALRLTESGVRYLNKKREEAGSCETMYTASDSSSQEPIYSEIILNEMSEGSDRPMLADDGYDVIRSRYFYRDEEDYFIQQLQIGYIVTAKKPANSPLKKSRKTKAVVVEISHRVTVACLDTRTKNHTLTPLQNFWTIDSMIRIDNSQDEHMPTWPTREIIKRATEYESFGVNAKSCDEFVKWCRYDGVYLPVHWKKVMSAAAKRLTAQSMSEQSRPRQLSEGEIANVAMNVLRDFQAVDGKNKRRKPSKKRLSMGDIEEMEKNEEFHIRHESEIYDDISTVHTSTQYETSRDGWTQEPEHNTSNSQCETQTSDNEGDIFCKIPPVNNDEVTQLERCISSSVQEYGSSDTSESTNSLYERKAKEFSKEKITKGNLLPVLNTDQGESSHEPQSSQKPGPWDNYETKSPYYTIDEKDLLFTALKNADILEIKSKRILGSLLHLTTNAIVVESGTNPEIAFIGEGGQHTVCELESFWNGQQIRIDNSMDNWNPVLPLDEVIRRARNSTDAPKRNHQFVTWCRYDIIMPPVEATMKMVTLLAANATFFVVGPFSATLVLVTSVILTKLASSKFLRKYIL